MVIYTYTWIAVQGYECIHAVGHVVILENADRGAVSAAEIGGGKFGSKEITIHLDS